MLGIGDYAALFTTCEIGDIHRFSSPQKLCSYAGLAPSVYQSAKIRRDHIIKEGNKLLRWIIIKCVHVTVESDPLLGGYYDRLKKRKGVNKAIVAVAIKILCYIYTLLTETTP